MVKIHNIKLLYIPNIGYILLFRLKVYLSVFREFINVE